MKSNHSSLQYLINSDQVHASLHPQQLEQHLFPFVDDVVVVPQLLQPLPHEL